MALVRGLIRRGVRNLRLVPAPGSIAPDMLIGAGCVTTTGMRVHQLRASRAGAAISAARRNRARSRCCEMDGPAIAGGLRAGACDLPYGLIPDLGTDLPRVNPRRLSQAGAGRRPATARSAGDQARRRVLHGQQADEEGNVQYFGAGYSSTC